MTATCAGSSLAAKGLDISLAALQRQDPYINNIVDVASQVALYTYNNRVNEWEKTEVEGTLFIYTRLASPRHGFTIMNRLSMENLTEPITKDLDFQLQDPFLLYRNARLVIHGIWFYDKEDCQRIAQRMKFLTHQEQLQAHSQGGWLSPGGNEGKPVDIIQMLSKARTEYDKEKSSSEPKEIGGSSVLYGNPNLIKPIPVKPNTQEKEGGLSLAALFGTQQKHPSSQPAPGASPSSIPNFGKITRPPVARTLTYEGTKSSGQTDNPADASREDGTQQQSQSQHCPAIQKLMQGQRGVLQTVSESPENRLSDNGVQIEHQHVYHQPHPHHHHLHHQQHPVQLQIHPDPIKRLFQTQPPVSSVAPLCCQHLPAQPVTVAHHQPHPNQPHPNQPHPNQPHPGPPHPNQPHPSPPHPNQPHSIQPHPNQPHPHQPHPNQPHPNQLHPNQPHPNQLHPKQPHPNQLHPNQPHSSQPHPNLPHPNQPHPNLPHPNQPHPNQLLILNRPPGESHQQNCQLAPAATLPVFPGQMPGVVSPHELLQKLQIVQQQQQSLTLSDPPQLGPALAPRFMAPAQSDTRETALNQVPSQPPATAGQKAALQFQVISPQRIPATVAPTMLLSPSVFSQTKLNVGLAAAPDTRPGPSNPVQILSRSQLQATLLHLIQNDSSFLDCIYEAYTSRFSSDPCSRY